VPFRGHSTAPDPGTLKTNFLLRTATNETVIESLESGNLAFLDGAARPPREVRLERCPPREVPSRGATGFAGGRQ